MAVLIKRYANRKLYNTESSRYITLKGISELIREGKDIRVIDNESGDEITSIVLSQILVDDQKQGRDRDGANPLSGQMLSELIQKGGDALYGVLRRSVDDAQDNISEFRENVRRWMQAPHSQLDPTEISSSVQQAVERVLKLVDLPTRSDLEALNKNLDRLASALEHFESRVRNSRD